MEVLNAGFAGTLQWVLHHGYPFLFVLMLVEGPVVTAAAAFAAALHYMNVWIVFLLSILANLIPDLIYYAIGYWGRESFINKYGHYIGITPERVVAIERMAEQHSGKSLILIKMVPFIATPGLILVGATRMDVKKYALWSLGIILPSSGLYLVLGYYFGAAYATIERYLHMGAYIAVAAAAIVVIAVYFQRKYFTALFKKAEEEEKAEEKDHKNG